MIETRRIDIWCGYFILISTKRLCCGFFRAPYLLESRYFVRPGGFRRDAVGCQRISVRREQSPYYYAGRAISRKYAPRS